MLLLRPDQYLSHVTAALIWGCPVPLRLRQAAVGALHVSTIGQGPVERRSGMIGHRIRHDRAEVVTARGFRTSSPATFWYECRTLLSVRSLVVLGDHLVGTSGLCEREWLEATIHSGDRAVTRARIALELVRAGSESAMETIVRIIVVEAGFPEPALNVDVGGADGVFIGRVDLAWPDLKIAIEYDGDHHRTDRETFQRDRGRSNDFSVAQWLVIHVTAGDVRAPSTFLDQLRQAFALRTR